MRVSSGFLGNSGSVVLPFGPMPAQPVRQPIRFGADVTAAILVILFSRKGEIGLFGVWGLMKYRQMEATRVVGQYQKIVPKTAEARLDALQAIQRQSVFGRNYYIRAWLVVEAATVVRQNPALAPKALLWLLAGLRDRESQVCELALVSVNQLLAANVLPCDTQAALQRLVAAYPEMTKISLWQKVRKPFSGITPWREFSAAYQQQEKTLQLWAAQQLQEKPS